MSKLRVLLADDHAVLREGVAALINAQDDMQVIAHASDGASAVDQALALRPDVLVMDLSMPGMGGVQATEAIAREDPQVQILILTRHAERGYVHQALHAGARGYVLKQAVATELLAAIRVVATGATYLDPALSTRVGQQLGEGALPQSPDARSELSDREAAVVRLIAHGYSNKEIATQLDLSVKTVDTYKTRATDKLGLYGRAALVRYALQQGWLDSEA